MKLSEGDPHHLPRTFTSRNGDPINLLFILSPQTTKGGESLVGGLIFKLGPLGLGPQHFTESVLFQLMLNKWSY